MTNYCNYSLFQRPIYNDSKFTIFTIFTIAGFAALVMIDMQHPHYLNIHQLKLNFQD